MRKQMKNKKTKKGILNKTMTGVALSTVALSSVVTPTVADAATVKTKNVNFEESMQQNRSKTITIPNLKSVSNVRSSTGTATAEVNGNQVTINVSGGTPTRSVWNPTKYSKPVSFSKTVESSKLLTEEKTVKDDFESSTRTISVTGDWVRTTDLSNSGNYSLRSQSIDGTGSSSYEIKVTVPENAKKGKVQFKYAIHSNNGNTQKIFVNGVPKVGWNGGSTDGDWVHFEEELTPGTHTIKLEYVQNVPDEAPMDSAMFIDDFEFTYEMIKGADSEAYSDGSGFEGLIARQGYANPTGGSFTPTFSKLGYHYLLTEEGGDPDSLPSSYSYTDEDGYTANLPHIGKAKVIAGSPYDEQQITYNYSSEEPHYSKLTTQEVATWTNGTYTGDLTRTSMTWELVPQATTVKIRYTIHSDNPNDPNNTNLDPDFVMPEVINQFPQLSNPTFESYYWETPLMEHDHEWNGDQYTHERSAIVTLRVDGFIVHSVYEGTVSKPDTRIWAKEYIGTVTKPGTDTRTWQQNYSGTAYKGENEHYYDYNVTFDYVDNSDPTQNVTAPVDNNKYSGVQNTLRLQGTVNDPDVGDTLKIYYRIDGYNGQAGTLGQTITGNGSNQNFAFDVNVGSLPEGTHRIYTWVDDGKGGKSSEQYKTFVVDKTAPTKANFTPSTTSPTNENVSVIISYPQDANVKEYKIGASGTWSDYSSPVILSSNNTIYARSIDDVGNVSTESSYTVNNIDKTAPNKPTLSANVTNPTNSDVVVTVSYPVDTKVKQVRVNGGSWTNYTSAITMKTNGKVEARAIDEAGNVSEIGFININNIDKTAPIKATFTPSTTAPTNKNVTVTINFPEDASVKEYKLGANGTWKTYSAPISISSNTTVFARSKDAVGNLSDESSYVVNNIDKVAPEKPTFSASTTSPTNKNVTVSISYPSDSSVKEYRVNGGSWTLYTNPVVMTDNGTVEARAKDEAGNYSDINSINITNIDKTAPVNPTFVASTTAPTNQNVSVTISYPEDATVKQYKVGSGSWTNYTTPVVLNANNTVYARAYDSAGNISNEVNFVVSNIDKVAPNKPTVSADKTTPTNGNVVLTAIFPSDASVKEYRVNGGNWIAYSSPVTFTANGKFEARAMDQAGNYSTIETYNVTNIDKTAPEKATFSADKTAPTNTDVKVTITYPDDATVKQYKVSESGLWTDYSNSVTVSGNTTIFARSYDAVGNVSEVSSYAVTNINKVIPTTPTLSANITDPTNTDVVVSVSYPSNAEAKQVRVNGGTWQDYKSAIVMKENGTVEARAIDEVGNVSQIGAYEVTNIDKTPPNKATFSPSTTTLTNQNVSVTINFPQDASVKEYKIGESGTWRTYTTPVSVSSNNTVYARSMDNVGNISEVANYQVTNIDKVAPTTPVLNADLTNPTNKNVTVSVSYPSDTDVKEVRVNGGAWTDYENPIVMTANGTVEARAKDEAGNYSSIGKYNVTNIDKTAPTKATFTPSTTAPTNKNVTVTISYPVDSNVKEYKVGEDGTWKPYVNPVILSENAKVFARSTDEAGNTSAESSYVVNNIDTIAPTTPVLTADITSPTDKDVKVSVSYPSDAKVKEVRVNGGAWKSYTSPIVMKENGKVEARAFDEAGNVSNIGSYEVTNIDKTTSENPPIDPDKPVIPSPLNPDNPDESIDINEDYKEILDELEEKYPKIYDIMWLIAKERWDILQTEPYNMSRVSYEALVQTYFSIKYTGDMMVGWADKKVALVPTDDSYYGLTTDQWTLLEEKYHNYVEDRIQTEQEIKAESMVRAMENSYQPDLLEQTQALIDAVQDEEVREELQQRLDASKEKYEQSLLDKTVQTAIHYVERAEENPSTYYINSAYSKVNALSDEFANIKAELTKRLQKIENDLALEKQISNAIRYVEYAERMKTNSYIEKAQSYIDALPDDVPEKASLQERLDVVTDGLNEAKQSQIIANAEKYLNYAERMKTQTYIDKAQSYIDQITDETKQAELQTQLDAVKEGVSTPLSDSNGDKEQQKIIAEAEKQLNYAERVGSPIYFTKAQEAINQIEDVQKRAELQLQLDSLIKSDDLTQEELVAKAEQYVEFAEQLKDQVYVDKAQSYLDLIEDEADKLELQNRLDAVAVEELPTE